MTIKVKQLYKHKKTFKYYNDLFNEIVESGAKRYEDTAMSLATSPTPKALEEMRVLLVEKGKKEVSDQEVWEANHSLMMFGSIAIAHAYRKLKEKERRKRIKEWRDRDRAKDERILNTKPLAGIRCPVCKSTMKYQWSELHDRGTLKKPDEVVMFFYECPKKCKRRIMFEDGTPWISKTNNTCPMCSTQRNTTVTKDNTGIMYFIYECPKCGSRQVEKEND